MILIKLFINVLIIGLFLYSKLLPFKDKLSGSYSGVFSFFNSILAPILTFLKTFFKPFQVGQGLSVDMTQIILLILLLFINTIFR
jgi:hypothetical protein